MAKQPTTTASAKAIPQQPRLKSFKSNLDLIETTPPEKTRLPM